METNMIANPTPGGTPKRPQFLFSALFAAFVASAAPNCSTGGEGDEGGGGSGGEATGGKGGSGKGGSGGSSKSGGSSGATGACKNPAEVREAALEGCDTADTVAAYETDVIKKGCGKNSTCHFGVFEPRYKAADMDVFQKLAGVKSKTLCTENDTFYIDLDDPMKSFMLTKTSQESPTCPGDEAEEAGVQMPYQEEVLTADELTCLEAYVKAVADTCTK